ncbi:MAG: hypothetical protein OCD76_07390 [Reichenbachiella sp.]
MSGETATALGSFVSDADKAAFVTRLWTEWDADRDPAIQKWREIEAYRYATDTNSLPNAKGAFSHSTHTPVVSAIAQDLEAILLQVVMPHDDWFTFEPMDAQAARLEQRKVIVSYLKNRLALNGYVEEVAKLRSDLVTYGNCFSQVFHANETRGDKAGYIGPKIRRISPYDIAFDPTATDFASSPKVIREIITLGELKRRGNSNLLDSTIVDKLLTDRGNFANSDAGEDKNEQYIPLGFGTYQQYITSGFIELLWFYGDVYDEQNQELHEAQVVVVADSSEVLLQKEIDTVTGNPHIFQSVWQRLPDNLWGMGPLENIIGLNYQVNHRENAKSEALDRLIYPDKVYVGDVEEMYDDETGQVTYLAPEGGGVNELAINTQFFSFDLHIDRLTHSARSAARLPSDLTGFRSQGEKTLGEVTALTEGGMRGFVDKAADFERSSLENHLKASVELAYDNFGNAFQVPNQSESGFIEMLNVTKEDLAVNGILIPKGSRRFARKNQMLSSLTQLSATPLLQFAAPHMSGKATATLVAELLEIQDTGMFEEFAQIIEQGEAQQVANQVEQSNAIQASQPSLEEQVITNELEGLE